MVVAKYLKNRVHRNTLASFSKMSNKAIANQEQLHTIFFIFAHTIEPIVLFWLHSLARSTKLSTISDLSKSDLSLRKE